jgi:peroxiredoxin
MSRFRDNASEFSKAATRILGISVDSSWANKAFREQLGLDFPVLSDSSREVSRLYGVLDEKSSVARRTTFVIDTEGVVRHIDQGRDAMDPASALAVCSLLNRPTRK